MFGPHTRTLSCATLVTSPVKFDGSLGHVKCHVLENASFIKNNGGNADLKAWFCQQEPQRWFQKIAMADREAIADVPFQKHAVRGTRFV